MALFCDFENVALGVKELGSGKFEIKPVLERLLLKGSIVVKKAYCDWQRYKEFKPALHEAGFEMIEIPHVRQSGKNSADIRMVVDALDLCYTKAHVDTFVVISGDSDFSPLVSKLRENNKRVIGIGVRNSTSDLLVSSCDEFIYYDELVTKARRKAAPKSSKSSTKAKAASAETPAPAKAAGQDDPQEGLDLILATVEALAEELTEDQKLWGSMVKQTLRRQRPGFRESSYGFSTFGAMLEEAAARGLLTLEKDAKSGGYIITGHSGQ